MSEPFRFLLRVRYGECDAQGVVFNARWSEYVDVAITEYTRAVFGTLDAAVAGEWQVVKQTLQWRASARYDDVLEIRVQTSALGTTSFTITSEFRLVSEVTNRRRPTTWAREFTRKVPCQSRIVDRPNPITKPAQPP